jgi:hypothetical protein
MDFGKLLKWIVIVALLVFGWKTLGPRIKEKLDSSTRSESPAVSSAGSGCVQLAAAASDEWGSGLSRFINPPHDLDAWGRFRTGIETKISRAQAQCRCSDDSCTRAASALADLRGLIGEMDMAIRGDSSPPANLVQRQESIDNAIEEARGLVRSGK